MKVSKWSFHNCRWDPECRSVTSDPPNRVYVGTPAGFLIVALDWDSRTQAWFPFVGHTRWWWPIVWQPRADRRRR